MSCEFVCSRRESTDGKQFPFVVIQAVPPAGEFGVRLDPHSRPRRMVIAFSTGLGLLLVKSVAAVSDSFPSVLSSIFPIPSPHGINDSHGGHSFAKREELSNTTKIVFGCLIPVLVILSGVFAGLTLGYMSLDETQLNVLSISGTA